MEGTIAQLVEQRTENPCVAGSTPAGTTGKTMKSPVNVELAGFFVWYLRNYCETNAFFLTLPLI